MRTVLLRCLESTGLRGPVRRARKTLRRYGRILRASVIPLAATRWRLSRRLARLERRERVRVAFIVTQVMFWKQERVAMALHERPDIDVDILMVPSSVGTPAARAAALRELERLCESRGLNALAVPAEAPLHDVLRARAHDVVFFENQNMHVATPFDRHKLDPRTVKCYLPYSFRIDTHFEYHFGQPFHEIMDLQFLETHEHVEYARSVRRRNAVTCRAVGFPPIRTLAEAPRPATRRPTILYCPHWTVPGTQPSGLDWGTFHVFGDLLRTLATQQADRIDFIFRPHPLLETHLAEAVWDPERVARTFDFWRTAPNCEMSEGGFEDDIARADMILHDCGSFMVEALATDCIPVFLSDGPLEPARLAAVYNPVGRAALACHEPVTDADGLVRTVNALAAGRATYTKAPARDAFRARYLDPFPDPPAAIVAALFPGRASARRGGPR